MEKGKIQKALNMAKQIVSAFVDNYGCDDFRSRVVTFEDSDGVPFAEVLCVFKGIILKQVQIQENGLTYTKDVKDENEAIEDICAVVTELGKHGEINLVWLGE